MIVIVHRRVIEIFCRGASLCRWPEHCYRAKPDTVRDTGEGFTRRESSMPPLRIKVPFGSKFRLTPTGAPLVTTHFDAYGFDATSLYHFAVKGERGISLVGDDDAGRVLECPAAPIVPAPTASQAEAISAPSREGLDGEEQACRVCGCTQNDCSQCIERTGSPCWWVEDDLCSACYEAADPSTSTKAVPSDLEDPGRALVEPVPLMLPAPARAQEPPTAAAPAAWGIAFRFRLADGTPGRYPSFLARSALNGTLASTTSLADVASWPTATGAAEWLRGAGLFDRVIDVGSGMYASVEAVPTDPAELALSVAFAFPRAAEPTDSAPKPKAPRKASRGKRKPEPLLLLEEAIG